ncbi:acyl carrier protein [Pontibacter ummariensis]|uniref:Acyl carrier protein n=1 Tax=Pontibacter ummariensis TaxID=1610492 RepID=A0A239L0K1_9BACT|nr:phosphopantetheine-binding protein [Pontibacter ummariensis]PRY04614.1 acyl carrier protein [Pontibacter ummariensis]SNT24107.1 acyl carrier protein [Pontibacter ummariensis]
MLITNNAIEQEVIRVISRTKKIKPDRLQAEKRLFQDFGFDTVDLVDIILELEKNFHITIPDEVPIDTVGDFIDYVAANSLRKAS